MPIITPHALLSRHPQSIRLLQEDGTLSSPPPPPPPPNLQEETTTTHYQVREVQGISELRRDVAHKMVVQSLPGQRYGLMKAVLQEQQEQQQIRREQEQQQQQLLVGGDPFWESADAVIDDSSTSRYGGCSDKIPGTISVLEMLQYQMVLSSTTKITTTGEDVEPPGGTGPATTRRRHRCSGCRAV